MGIKAPEYATSLQDQTPPSLKIEENYRIGDVENMLLKDKTLKIPKPVLESLDKKFVGLQNQVIDLTQTELDNLKILIDTKDYVKLEETLRKELIEEQVENNDVKLETLSTGAKGTIPESVLKKLGTNIDSNISIYGLTSQQKENIKIGIVAKILKSGKVDLLLNSFKDTAGGMLSDTLINFNEKKYNEIIANEMKDILGLLEKSKAPESKKLLEGLLSNPKAIEEYKEKGKIEGIEKMNPEELVNYLSGLNNSVLNIEKKGSNIKDTLMTSLSKMPKGILEFLLGIFQKFIGFFMGKEGAEKLIGGLKKDIENRKSVNKLQQYGNITNEKGEIVAGGKNGEIDLFENKNLNGLESKKLSKFFDNCRSKGIDITGDDFWEKVLQDKKIEKETPKKDDKGAETNEIEKTTFTFNEVKSETIKGESNKPDFKSFYDLLNSKDFIKEIPAPTDKPVVQVDKPAVQVDKPAVQVDKPAVQVDKPAVQADKPAVQADKPAVQADKPATEEVNFDYDELVNSGGPGGPQVTTIKLPPTLI